MNANRIDQGRPLAMVGLAIGLALLAWTGVEWLGSPSDREPFVYERRIASALSLVLLGLAVLSYRSTNRLAIFLIASMLLMGLSLALEFLA